MDREMGEEEGYREREGRDRIERESAASKRSCECV